MDAAVELVSGTLQLGTPGWRTIATPDGLDDVVIVPAYLTHLVEDRRAVRERYANFIAPTFTDPLKVWLSEYEDGSLRRCFIKWFAGDDARPASAIARKTAMAPCFTISCSSDDQARQIISG